MNAGTTNASLRERVAAKKKTAVGHAASFDEHLVSDGRLHDGESSSLAEEKAQRDNVLLHLDPSLLPTLEDERRWQVLYECGGYLGPKRRDVPPSQMMTFALSNCEAFESEGSPPEPLVDLRRMLVLLVLSNDQELRALLRGDSVECYAADPRGRGADLYSLVDFAGPTAHRRRMQELQAVGLVLQMVIDLNVEMFDRAERLPTDTTERAGLLRWRHALGKAHKVSDAVDCGALLQQLQWEQQEPEHQHVIADLV